MHAAVHSAMASTVAFVSADTNGRVTAEVLDPVHPRLGVDDGAGGVATETRSVACTTNAIVLGNARIRRAVTARGHFPDEQAGLQRVCMEIRSVDPTGKEQARRTIREVRATARVRQRVRGCGVSVGLPRPVLSESVGESAARSRSFSSLSLFLSG